MKFFVTVTVARARSSAITQVLIPAIADMPRGSLITSGLIPPSGFAQSDRPIWTNFVGEKFRQCAFFCWLDLQKRIEKLFWNPKYPKQIIGVVNVEYIYTPKKLVLSKTIFK